MGMPHSPKAIANLFLELAEKDGQALTQMKLHKLVYYAHGWCLAIYDAPLINEKIEAWQYGPLIRSLYEEFVEFGSSPITRPASDVEIVHSEDGQPGLKRTPSAMPADDLTRELVRLVWKSYKKYSAAQLMRKTHEKDSPWEQTWSKNEGVRGADIQDKSIKEYFDVKYGQMTERGNAGTPA